jgi:secondary thiamine-phosphate synthase enzyme
MVVFKDTLAFRTSGEGTILDLTSKVEECVRRSGIGIGMINCFAEGATAALTVLEFEEGLLEDLPAMLERIAPKGIDYAHHRAWSDGNGHSHVRASLIGPDITLPVRDGALVRGTWQHIIFLELDVRPYRDRKVHLTVIGE